MWDLIFQTEFRVSTAKMVLFYKEYGSGAGEREYNGRLLLPVCKIVNVGLAPL